MSPESEVGSLLATLRGLYSRIAMLVLHRRMNAYRRHDGSGSGDIAATLAEHIQKVASDHERDAASDVSPGLARTVQPARHRAGTIPPAAQGEEEQRPLTRGELGRHFESSHAGAVFDPHLGADLKRRTWEHIHSALRYAAQGRASPARLHADLATNAFTEAAHYLPDDEIAEFAAAVQEKLKSISLPAHKTDD